MDIAITMPMKAGKQLEVRTMKVWAKNEEVSKVLRHPTGGGFMWPTPADWPDDTYTFRQVQAGDVLLQDPGDEKTAEKKVAPKPKE